MAAGDVAVEQALADDDLPPDEDDLDTVDYSDPAEGEPEQAPAGEGPGDQGAADMDPVTPATGDAPFDPAFPGNFDPLLLDADLAGLVVPVSAESGPPGGDAGVVARWRARLRIRQQLLEDAKRELAAAHTPQEVEAAKAKVHKREQQVAEAKRVIERHKTTVVERVVRAATLALDHRDLVHYTMDRPFRLAAQGGVPRRWDGIRLGLRSKKGQFPRFADCSSFVTWCFWDALGGPKAGPDVINGQNWQAGFTGTQMAHGREVPIGEARAGDLAFYDRGGTIGHVTVVVAPGTVISHGSEAGPFKLALNFDGMLRHVRRYVT